mgnify:FL=1
MITQKIYQYLDTPDILARQVDTLTYTQPGIIATSHMRSSYKKYYTFQIYEYSFNSIHVSTFFV